MLLRAEQAMRAYMKTDSRSEIVLAFRHILVGVILDFPIGIYKYGFVSIIPKIK